MDRPEVIQQPSISNGQLATAWELLRIFAGAIFAILLFVTIIALSGASRSSKRPADRLLTVSEGALGMTYADYAKIHPEPCADNICTTNAVYAGKPVQITAQFFQDRLFDLTYEFDATQGESLCKAMTDQYGDAFMATIDDEKLYFFLNGSPMTSCSTSKRHATVSFLDSGLLKSPSAGQKALSRK